MGWNESYRIRSYLRSSLWIVPFIAIPLELVAVRLLRGADAWLGWTFLGLSTLGAQELLHALVTATLSFVVFTFGSLLVAIQVASGQLTPRIIATTLLRNDVVRYSVGLFIFTFLFSVGTLNRVQTNVDQFSLFIAACLGIACFATFLYLIDYAAKLLRPITILTHVAREGLSVIESVYPDLSPDPSHPEDRPCHSGSPLRTIKHQGSSQIVLAVHLKKLFTAATTSNGAIEIVPQVGDFIARDEPLFNLYGGAAALDDQALRAFIAFGPERTIEQDPTFACRIIVDIALKALSSAINDPTTAILAMDQLHRLLRLVGTRNMRNDEVADVSGALRVIFRTPNWEDFVHLAFTEVRHCGANSIQVARRMRAMIDNLVQTLPSHRHMALQQELTLLNREIERRFSAAEDLALARIPDSQGLGGRYRSGSSPN